MVEEAIDDRDDRRAGKPLSPHQAPVEDRSLEVGERSTVVEVTGQSAVPDRTAQQPSQRLTALLGQLSAQRLEGGVEPRPLAEEVDDEAEVAVLQSRAQSVEVLDEIRPQIARHGRMRHLGVGERVAQQREGVGPVSIEGAPAHTSLLRHAEMGDGIDTLLHEEPPSSLERRRPRSFHSRIHGGNSGTTCARRDLRHNMCHMSRIWAHQAVEFFAELEQNNDREWWLANRTVYDTVIKPAFVGLLEGVGDVGEWRVYRPNNDTRFGAAKGPYKTFVGAVSERADGVGVFVQVSAQGLLVGTGMPLPAKDQLERLRAALDETASGESFCVAVEAVRASGARVFHGRWDPLSRVPRGYPSDHPRAEFLRWKGVEIAHREGLPAWLAQPIAAQEVCRLIGAGEPLHQWLARHVGPSSLTPEERFAPRRRTHPT